MITCLQKQTLIFKQEDASFVATTVGSVDVESSLHIQICAGLL